MKLLLNWKVTSRRSALLYGRVVVLRQAVSTPADPSLGLRAVLSSPEGTLQVDIPCTLSKIIAKSALVLSQQERPRKDHRKREEGKSK